MEDTDDVSGLVRDLEGFIALQNAARFLIRHREGRAILTSLEGASTRLWSARDDHKDLVAALEPSGDMYRQNKAFSHFCGCELSRYARVFGGRRS